MTLGPVPEPPSRARSGYPANSTKPTSPRVAKWRTGGWPTPTKPTAHRCARASSSTAAESVIKTSGRTPGCRRAKAATNSGTSYSFGVLLAAIRRSPISAVSSSHNPRRVASPCPTVASASARKHSPGSCQRNDHASDAVPRSALNLASVFSSGSATSDRTVSDGSHSGVRVIRCRTRAPTSGWCR